VNLELFDSTSDSQLIDAELEEVFSEVGKVALDSLPLSLRCDGFFLYSVNAVPSRRPVARCEGFLPKEPRTQGECLNNL
jgi:hypothetical protein